MTPQSCGKPEKSEGCEFSCGLGCSLRWRRMLRITPSDGLLSLVNGLSRRDWRDVAHDIQGKFHWCENALMWTVGHL
jgi:hypothetical protein